MQNQLEKYSQVSDRCNVAWDVYVLYDSKALYPSKLGDCDCGRAEHVYLTTPLNKIPALSENEVGVTSIRGITYCLQSAHTLPLRSHSIYRQIIRVDKALRRI